MQSFEDLEVWKTGVDLADEVYELVKKLPKNEEYALSQQLRKASTAIGANVAEGYSRHTYPDKVHKFTIARGECSEVKGLLLIALRLKLLEKIEVQKALQLCESTGRLLSGLIKYCRRQERSSTYTSPYAASS